MKNITCDLYVVSFGQLDMVLSPLLSWWRYCVSKAEILAKKKLTVAISGQSQAYAQAALQYAYAPNMLTAQQLTAAGLDSSDE